MLGNVGQWVQDVMGSIVRALLRFFAVSGPAIVAAGPRLASVADVPADRTGSGEAVVRATLLAVVTSPGGIATSLAAAHAGDAGVAVSNAAGAIVNIGFESLPILIVYAGSFVLLALPLAPFGLFSRLPLDALP